MMTTKAENDLQTKAFSPRDKSDNNINTNTHTTAEHKKGERENEQNKEEEKKKWAENGSVSRD